MSSNNSGKVNSGKTNVGGMNAGRSNSGKVNSTKTNVGGTNAGRSNSGKENSTKTNAGGMNASRSNSGRMNSITKRLVGTFTRNELGRIIGSTIFIFILAVAVYMFVTEHSALGFFSIHTDRSFELVKSSSGSLREILYKLAAENGKTAEVEIFKMLKNIGLTCNIVLIVRVLILFLIRRPLENKKYMKVLSPLNELALKADELSKLEFGEDKYQLIEDAISHLDAGEGSTLSLGDRDLLGVEAAINNLLLRVRESNKQQARFVNDASHELRTPIAVISGYADMLARWGRDDEKVLDESIVAIQKESTRMKHLVEQLLFLARGDSGRTALQLEETDLRDLMREAYEESVMIDENHVYKFNVQAGDAAGAGGSGTAGAGSSGTAGAGGNGPAGAGGSGTAGAGGSRGPANGTVSGGGIPGGGIPSSSAPASGTGLTVYADPGMLKQAVRILIDNAAKYTKEHDEILLGVGISGGHPYLQVQDCGIGMAEADVPHMFDRFYRADEARSFEGTGLGLSIAKWIVDKHGGHFEIVSRKDLGTRIRIVL